MSFDHKDSNILYPTVLAPRENNQEKASCNMGTCFAQLAFKVVMKPCPNAYGNQVLVMKLTNRRVKLSTD